MDYGMMLAEHAQSHADMTIACLEVPIHEAHAFGVVTVDESERITSFQEKPANPTAVPDKPEQALVSMGVYLFKSEFLFDQLIRNADIADSGHDFGKDIIPNIVSEHCVMAHRFRRSCNLSAQRCYWRDIGNIDAYWEANMELIQTTPALNLYDRTWPIWTYQEQLPPAKFIFDSPSRRGVALDSLVSGGCIISGAMVRRSVLFSNVVVDGGKTLVEDSLLLPDVHISPGARLRRTIVERGTEIPPGLVAGESADDDARRFYRSPRGVTLINSAMLKNGRVPSESPALGSIPPGWADQ
jgi:glucose-1-phosphate adenylyltransferase